MCEQIVLLSLGGNLEMGFALPAIYSDAFPPPGNSEDGTTTVFIDGSGFEYEPDSRIAGQWFSGTAQGGCCGHACEA